MHNIEENQPSCSKPKENSFPLPHNEAGSQGVNLSKTVLPSYQVSLTVMRKRRTSPQVLLKTSVSTILLISVVFMVVYTILLKYFSPRVPYIPEEWEQVRSHHRLIPRPLLEENYLSKMQNKTIVWKWTDYFLAWDLKNNKYLCPSSFQIILLVLTGRNKISQRESIRQTWCQEPSKFGLPKSAWKCIFLMGSGSTPFSVSYMEEQKRIEEESQMYHDILLGSYIDSYRNLTLKVVHGLHWVSQHCQAEFVLKSDDDCFVNTHLLHTLIMHHRDASNLYVGTVTKKNVQVIRNPDNRNYVSKESYSEDNYPLYASGLGYLLSFDVVKKIQDACFYTKPFANEDAYIGVILNNLGLNPFHSARFTVVKDGWKMCNYLYLLVIHGILPLEQHVMHNNTLMASNNSGCMANRRAVELMFTWN